MLADPSVTSLEAQAAIPVFGTHPVEMGMADQEPEIAKRLGSDRCYRDMFKRAFPEDGGRIDFSNVAKAIASFERTLVSFGSDFDKGDLPEDAGVGQRVFERTCSSCHSGPNFTDLAYHRIGPFEPASTDLGLGEKTGQAEDRGKFRTPSLRNVALSAPYWHDGSVRTLAEAVDRHGLHVAEAERAPLLAFLDALTDRDFVSRKSLAMPMTACGKPL